MNVRLAGPNLACRIGHLAIEPMLFIKAKETGLLPADWQGRMPDDPYVNERLREYWVRRGLPMVTGGEQHFDTSPQIFGTCVDGRWSYGFSSVDRIQQAWGERDPVLTVAEEDVERGWDVLEAAGVPRGSRPPFVCLHVQERDASGGSQDYRNADIATYEKAIRAVTERRMWVVRVGYPGTRTMLPACDRVFDYARSTYRADWMDLFLIGTCEFVISTTSSSFCLAAAFGRPVLGTNWAPVGFGPLGIADMSVPKRFRRAGCTIPLREVLMSDIRNFSYVEDYAAAGLDVIDNTPEELEAATNEMLDAYRGDWPVETDRQRRYRELRGTNPSVWGGTSRVSDSFLAKHG